MRWQEQQDQIEAEVYDVIDELSDLLSIPISYYPEVWWMGKTVDSDMVFLPEYLREELEIRNSQGRSYYIIDKRIVIIAEKIKDDILEEASHSFHFMASGISNRSRGTIECLYLDSLVEMFGFLGARLVELDSKNPYEAFPDIFRLLHGSQKNISCLLLEESDDNYDLYDFFVYQQGYGLADRIYFEYLSGNVSLSRLRRMFLNKFSTPNSAKSYFTRLKNEFWP